MRDQCIWKDNIKKGSKQTRCENTFCICWPLIRRWWTFDLTHLMFSQRYSWWIESSGMLWCVDWGIIPDVSNRCNPFIFRIKQSLDYFTPKMKALCSSETSLFTSPHSVNPLKPELNPICYLLALLGAYHFLHVSRIRVKLVTLRCLMSYIYIYGAPILDVSRSHTTTQHSR